ncbi:unnamed protein product, partial [Prorocentrum cordatum]
RTRRSAARALLHAEGGVPAAGHSTCGCSGRPSGWTATAARPRAYSRGHGRAATAAARACRCCPGRGVQAYASRAFRTECSTCGLAKGNRFLAEVVSKEASRRVPAATSTS